MPKFNTWLTFSLALLSSIALSQKTTAGFSKDNIVRDFIPNRFIVEFKNADALRRTAGSSSDGFLSTLRAAEIKATLNLDINSSVFQGMSFTTQNTTKIEELEMLDEVKNVWHVRKVPRPNPEINAIGNEARAETTWDSHDFTGVLNLHQKGIQGEGTTVAVVDTGIDYNHPSLGGGFGPSFKVVGGTDIVGDSYIGAEFFPDEDPMDSAGGHGTHVAGIIAGFNDTGFIGVAPKAKLRAYKVFGDNYAYTGDDALIKAFVTAYDEGADVINASIGGRGGWTEDAWAVVASMLVNKGVFITISAGNSGDAGIWYASSGSSGIDVLAVASVQTENFIGNSAPVNLTTSIKEIKYFKSLVEPFKMAPETPIYATSLDSAKVDDACDPLPADTPDLSNYLVLIRRGTCNFAVKESNAIAKGAKAVWFYNQEGRPITSPGGAPLSAMISVDDGKAIVAALVNKFNVTVNFPENAQPVKIPDVDNGGKMSTFSSWGPTYDAYMKPEIAAPGGGIYSTYPLSLGGHAILSGTSMASPYMAGVAALYIAAAGGRDALGAPGMLELKRKIMTSGELVNWNDGTTTDMTKLAPVAQQGAGYIKAEKIFYETLLSPSKIELNDTNHFKGEHFINVKNTGKKTVLYSVSHEPAETVFSFEAGVAGPEAWPPTLTNESATLKFSVRTFDVRPGTTNSFKVSFIPPSLPKDLLPVYSGKVVITGDNGETLSIPYQGILGSLFSVDTWDIKSGEPLYFNDDSGDIITNQTTFSLKNFDRPGVYFFNYFGSPEIRWDVVEPDWEERHARYPPVTGQSKYVGSVVDVYDGIRFPSMYNARNLGGRVMYSVWTGELTNGTVLTSGTYKFVFRALRVTGNPARNDNWQTVISPRFTIKQ